MDYGSIFYKDKPPLGFGDDWDQDWEKVPFPAVTCTFFLTFVISMTFIVFNVLVGLTVDDIRNILNIADTRTLMMKNDFMICQMGQAEQVPWMKNKKNKNPLNNTISKRTPFEAMIWKEIEKRQMESRSKGKMEEEMNKMQSKINELKEMNSNTNKLVAKRETLESVAQTQIKMEEEMRQMKSKNNELKEMLVNTNNMITDIKRSLRKD